MTKAMPPAAWKWFTSARPFGYTRASSGTTADRSAMSFQDNVIPAARAIATRCMVWLVEPPVASSATHPLTIARSSTIAPTGVCVAQSGQPVTRRPASAVNASRNGVSGLTRLEPGRCRPIASISSWLEFAVP